MRVLGSVVETAPHFAVIAAAEVLQCGTLRPQPIGHGGLGPTMALHRFLQEFQCSFAIAHLGDDAFQHLALLVDSSP
jgi:hypothetical protein